MNYKVFNPINYIVDRMATQNVCTLTVLMQIFVYRLWLINLYQNPIGSMLYIRERE